MKMRGMKMRGMRMGMGGYDESEGGMRGGVREGWE